MSDNHKKVIIIGSGPAGFTAAIYAARANLNPFVFEGNQPGGQLTITTEVENYPGFEHGIMGPELMDVMRKQAKRFGAEFEYKYIDKVDLSSRPFKLISGKETYTADAVIVATGASAKLLGIPSEQEYMGFGVSACATCDGFFFKEQEVIVVGGGDSAMEEANYLTKFASKVTIVHRREGFRASQIMLDRAKKNPKIEFRLNEVVEEILGKPARQSWAEGAGGNENGRKMVTGVRLRNVKTNNITEMKIDGIFMAIGHKPNTEIFKGILDMEESGYLKVKTGSTYTNIDGIFAAGDVADKTYRQAVTAAGMGCMAAIDAERWLEAQAM
ncbi:MAG: thioredoxin-disulfide reductase [Ignavibacteria bacterium]|nr:thioredoxin-disulfide reductase [Ignavibacteria bacterium]